MAQQPEEKPTKERMSELAEASKNAIRHEIQGEHETRYAARYGVPLDDARRTIEPWPDAPQAAAEEMLERYGPPNEATPTKLFWEGNGPWKRTFVTADVYTHHFPLPHSDYIAQTIDYQVPVERFEDIGRFDGSCLPDRTAGEVTARCDSEWANILTLNLMNDIVTGKRTVEEARETFGETASAYVLGRSAPYAEKLQFDVPEGDTEDLDEPEVAEEMMKQTAAKMSDALSGEESTRGTR